MEDAEWEHTHDIRHYNAQGEREMPNDRKQKPYGMNGCITAVLVSWAKWERQQV